MRGGEGRLLGRGGARHAADIVMAVALPLAEAEQGDQGEVLLQAEAGLGGQVFGRQERPAAPDPNAQRIDQRAQHPFAGLAADAAIAERAGPDEGVLVRIAFVDDHRQPVGQRSQRRIQGRRPGDGLFEIAGAGDQPLQPGFGGETVQHFDGRGGIGELLVAVQGHPVVGQPVEHGGDGLEAVDIRRRVAAELELEVAVAVAGDHRFQAHGQPVAGVVGHLRLRDRIGEAHGVADGDAVERPKVRQEPVDIGTAEIMGQQTGRQPDPVGAHRLRKRQVQKPANGIHQRPGHQGGTELGRQPRQGRQGVALALFQPADQGGNRPPAQIAFRQAGGRAQGSAELVDRLGRGQRRRLVEPFGHHQLGPRTGRLPSRCGLPDGELHEGLGCLGHRHRTEAERQPERYRPLPDPDGVDRHGGGAGHHAEASARPRRYPAQRAAQAGPSGS